MDVVYGLIPMMLIFGFLVVLVFIWMAKSGHFDDLDGAAHSIFMDDDEEQNHNENKAADQSASSNKRASETQSNEVASEVDPSQSDDSEAQNRP